VKRFRERFELWRQERAAEREDKSIAGLLFLAFVILAQGAFSVITTHQLTWREVFGSVMVLAFIVLYIRKARWTWVALAVLGVTFLADAPFVYESAPPNAPASIRFFLVALVLAFAFGSFIYSAILRRRFAHGPRTN
jgi:hypothetical protein